MCNNVDIKSSHTHIISTFCLPESYDKYDDNMIICSSIYYYIRSSYEQLKISMLYERKYNIIYWECVFSKIFSFSCHGSRNFSVRNSSNYRKLSKFTVAFSLAREYGKLSNFPTEWLVRRKCNIVVERFSVFLSLFLRWILIKTPAQKSNWFKITTNILFYTNITDKPFILVVLCWSK